MPGDDTSWVGARTRSPEKAQAPRPPCLEQLEPRVLLSADFGGIESALSAGALSSEYAIFIDIDPEPERTDRQHSECQITTAAEQQPRQVVFVDPSIAESEILLGGLSSTSEPSTRVVYLDPGQDGVQQITRALADDTDVAAIHILSHGSSGSVALGSTRLEADNLDTYAGEMSRWGSALTQDADILLYGCNVASGESGLRLIENLSLLTGADVAASEDATGPPSLGGDWDLEYTSGPIETPSLLGRSVVSGYGSLLGTVTGTADGDEITLATAAVTVGADTPTPVNPGDDLVVNGLEGDDTFIVWVFPGAASTAIDGGEGTDTLDLSHLASDLTITFHPDGKASVTDGINSIGGIGHVENIIGGSGTNTYIFEDGAGLAGTISGAGGAVLDYWAYSTDVVVDLAAGTATGTGGVSNIIAVTGGSGVDTLAGPDSDGAWTISGVGSGSVAGVDFSGIENLTGGSGADTFAFSEGARISGIIDGGDGIDVLDYTSYTPLATANLTDGLATGTHGITGIENTLGEDDPLLFVHGFAGSMPAEGQLGAWLSHRGFDPESPRPGTPAKHLRRPHSVPRECRLPAHRRWWLASDALRGQLGLARIRGADGRHHGWHSQ